jgi:uncharacterized protein (DUF1697 family)
MTHCAALLRGINVGRAKRIAMADLRTLVEGLGHSEVRTLLNSGNAVFKTKGSDTGKIAQALSKAIEKRFGLGVAVVVVTAPELAAIIGENPLAKVAKDPSRYLVAFVSGRADLERAKPLLDQSWAPEVMALGKHAAYLWCADGINPSKLWHAFTRATNERATARNWTTVLKLHAMMG